MKILSVLVFLLGFSGSFAQKYLIATVQDTGGNAIPYASIIINNIYGTLADSCGKFKIFDYSHNNSVEVISAEFHTKRLGHYELRQSPIIRLERKNIQEQKAVSKTTELLGYKKGKLFSIPLTINHNFDAGIIFPYPGKRAYISKIAVHAGFKGSPILPVRMNIYSLDKENLPTENLLKKEIIFTPKNALEWLDFDLTEQGIEFPISGVAVTFEPLNTSLNRKKLRKEFHLEISQYDPKSPPNMVIRQDVLRVGTNGPPNPTP